MVGYKCAMQMNEINKVEGDAFEACFRVDSMVIRTDVRTTNA